MDYQRGQGHLPSMHTGWTMLGGGATLLDCMQRKFSRPLIPISLRQHLDEAQIGGGTMKKPSETLGLKKPKGILVKALDPEQLRQQL